MNALTLLIADHNRLRGMFARFEEANEQDDTTTMQHVSKLVFAELDVHTEIEEQVLYPAVRRVSEEIEELVAEGLEEHHVGDVLCEEIKGLNADDEAWVAKMTVLIESVEHHIDEEEEELFPNLRRAIGSEELGRLGEQLEEKKAELGAPTVADKESLGLEELHHLATEQQIPGRSSMNREELLATVAPSS